MQVYKSPTDIDQLLVVAEQQQLYLQLMQQLEKDLHYACVAIDVETSLPPQELFQRLVDVVYRLIQVDFAKYLNVLYIVDVPEKEVKSLDGSDLSQLAAQVSFLILRRIWKKVWFRQAYSQGKI
ncbi:MAG: hypothetical protein KBS98_06175 [Flavobacterium sp.]|nr:hypothetical protein [Candidatus Neoflavobacterium equi]